MFKKYNDEQFKNVINSLKGLSQISAPDDFEINLKRKLNTIDPLPVPKRIRYHQFSRTLVPAFGVVVSILLIFLIISNQNSPDFENPFLKTPALRTLNENEQATGTQNKEMKISENDVVIQDQPSESKSLSLSTSNSVVRRENIVDEKKSRFIDLISSTTDENNVDKSLRAKPESNLNNNNNVGATVNFNGFNIVQEEDQIINELRARMDSLKKSTKDKK